MLKSPTSRYRLPAAVVLACTCSSHAGSLDLAINDRLFRNIDGNVLAGAQSASGLDITLSHDLFALALNYDIEMQTAAEHAAGEDDISQHFGASLNSQLLDSFLGGRTRVNTSSVMYSATGAYNHHIRPVYTRKLAGLGILQMDYQYLRNRASAQDSEQQQQAYSFGLHGTLHGGLINWSGVYRAADLFSHSSAQIQSSETVQLQSHYRLQPNIQLNLTSAITNQNLFDSQADGEFLHTQYGAGLSWKPREDYALDFALTRMGLSHTGEHTLLRTGSLSWFPRQDVTLSLNYGDQLIDGAAGFLLNTRLELDRL